MARNLARRLATLLVVASPGLTAGADEGLVSRGAYLLRAGGCVSCHTDKSAQGAFLAGGRALKTDFGTFYGPNLTPDPNQGLGRWSEEDFVRALRRGVAPDGRVYYPAFPYPSFTRIAEVDLKAIWAYLRTVAPAPRPNTAHALKLPFRWRFLVRFWRLLYFEPGAFRTVPGAAPSVERGRYLTVALGHCGECHTPRTALGGLKNRKHLAGSRAGPEGEAIPNLTPDTGTGLGSWSAFDVAELLRTGMTRDGDFVGSSMAEVVDDSTSHLTDADRASIAAYLRSLPALPNDVGRSKRGGRGRGDSEW